MKPFIHDDFLLETPLAVALFHEHAAHLPIIDYHCHLPPDRIAKDHRFRSIAEIWLEGDHYKWRAMRSNGIDEGFCTGNASDFEKFEAWARTVPATLRNPLFHWTQMELMRPFGVPEILGPATARDIYDRCNARLAEPEFSVRGLLAGFNVAVVCTTDDPVDELNHHQQMAAEKDPVTRVIPAWRPDKATAIEDVAAWNDWVGRLEAVSGLSIANLDTFFEALERRHAFFHALGCRLSDHGLETVWAEPWTDAEVAASFARLRSGKSLPVGEALTLKSALLHRLAVMDHARDWVQQYHLGALRNNNTRMRRRLGPDTGFDSIGDFEQGRPLAQFLDRLDTDDRLAKTILYNLNPRDNELFATIMGCFQDGTVPGKIQFGAAWWFLDQKDGMEAQLRALSNLGLLARFVGMLTDSRSFLSYSRHEYFRRILCNLLADDVRRGFLPDDRALLGRMVEDICFFNAKEYFGFSLGRAADGASRKA